MNKVPFCIFLCFFCLSSHAVVNCYDYTNNNECITNHYCIFENGKCTPNCTNIPTNQNSNQPTDTVTQWRDWAIDWDWRNAPDKNLIKQYAADPSTRMIILNLLPDGCSTTFCPCIFNKGLRNLENKFFSIYPGHIIGNGTIFVSRWGAHLPNPNAEDINGMALVDSLGYTALGFDIARGQPPVSK